jgi:hypothetical protein
MNKKNIREAIPFVRDKYLLKEPFGTSPLCSWLKVVAVSITPFSSSLHFSLR